MHVVTDPQPDDTEAPQPSPEARRQAARDDYQASLAHGVRLTGADLARRHGMSERWGRDRIAETRAHANGKVPVAAGAPNGNGTRPAVATSGTDGISARRTGRARADVPALSADAQPNGTATATATATARP